MGDSLLLEAMTKEESPKESLLVVIFTILVVKAGKKMEPNLSLARDGAMVVLLSVVRCM
jgi:hypothetical protein